MTLEVEAHYRERWDDRVRLRLQARGNRLKGTVMPPVRIDAEKFYFLRSGELNTSKWAGRGHAVNVQGSNDDRVEISSDEWDAPYHLYDRDKWKTNASEEQTRQNQAGNAIGRQADAIIYDAIMAETLPADQIVGDYTTGITPYMILEGETKLFERFTPNDGGIYCMMPPRQYERMPTFKIAGSSDWQGGDLPLTKMAKHMTFSSAHLFMGEQQHATKYTANTTELRFRMWHKECVGAGYVGQQVRTEWVRQGDYKRWLVIHTLDGAAVVIEPKGIVEFRVLANAPIEDEVQRTLAVT